MVLKPRQMFVSSTHQVTGVGLVVALPFVTD